MTKSHRCDVLTSALIHYGKKSSGKLYYSLPKKLEKAETVATACEEALARLLTNAGMSGNVDYIQTWIQEEKDKFTTTVKDAAAIEESKYVKYVRSLLANRELRQKLMIEDNWQDEKSLVANVELLRRSEKELAKIEKECGIRKRWTWSMDSAKEIVIEIVLEERMRLIETLRTLAHERLFLLKMKRLYANGQKLAKTLATSISKKNHNITAVLTPFNRKVQYLSKEVKELRGIEISIESARDPTSAIYSNISQVHDEIPGEVKQEAIDLFCRLSRAVEERDLVKADMANSVLFFRNAIEKVQCTLADFAGASVYERGATSLLKQDCLRLRGVLLQLTKSFSAVGFEDTSVDAGMTNIDDWAVDDLDEYIEDEEGGKDPEEDIEIDSQVDDFDDEVLDLFDY